MTKTANITIAALALFAGSETALATILPVSFGQGENLEFGTQKKEMYEVALRITPGEFEGGKITGIRVPVRNADISGVKLWLSRELKVELVDGKNITVPDILELPATINNDGIASATLDAPCPIPPEGIYVGYSFDVETLTNETKWPLFVSKSSSEEGFYFRSSRSYREWNNFSTEFGIATELEFDIDYDFKPDAVELVSVGTVRANYGEPFTVPAILETHGYQEVSSIDFEYSFGSVEGSTHYVLPTPVPAIYGRRLNVDLPFAECTERNNHELEVTITKVNDANNADGSPTAIGAVNIISHTARKRVVMEEYTGTWCGFCVKAAAAVEHMVSLYPDDFIPLVLHGGSSDPMWALETFPNSVPGYPHCWIDRAFDCDPYDGLHGEEFFGMEKTFLEQKAIPAPADIDIHADIDENFNISVSTTVSFVEIPGSKYKLGYALLEDNMSGTGPRWSQSNYYSGSNSEKYIPEMERFCNGNSYVVDMVFNEVVVMAPDIMGVDGSVEFVNTDIPITHEYIFPEVVNATNVFNESIIQNTSNLSVVALLIDTSDGHIANANKVKIGQSSVGLIDSAPREVKEYVWMSCDGKIIDQPCKGICIRLTRYTDGTFYTEKIFNK